MLSMRLWRSITSASIDDPIFRRVSQSRKPAQSPKPARALPRALLVIAAIAAVVTLSYAPGLLALLLVLPMLMITLIVATPILLPLYAWIAGIQLTAAVIAAIYREKHQHTYELLCATPPGSLAASWSCAIGILHRCAWFAPLHWGSRLSSRAGLTLLGILSAFVLLAGIADGRAPGSEQARLLLLIALGLALYYSALTQTMTLSLLVGLAASSLELSRQDATVIGLFAYVTLSLLPLIAGGLALAAWGGLAGAVAVLVLQELGLWVVWRGLVWRVGGTKQPHTLIPSLAK